MNNYKKYIFVASFALFGLVAIGLLFWYQDLRYSLPTPKPAYLKQPLPGERLTLADLKKNNARPVLLHFFNPSCPCSKFNVEHVRSLVKQYSSQVDFVAVVQAQDEEEGKNGFQSCHLDIPYIIDLNGAIADSCGVYSTPQAVLLDSQSKLYYRGNYNTSRYCTTPQTEFARLAIVSMLAGKPAPVLNEQAVVAYGCQLPKNDSSSTQKLFSLFNF